MARIRVDGEQIDQITNQIGQMSGLQIATLVGAAFTGFLCVGGINKLIKKTGYEFGFTYYIIGGILGVVALGVLQALLPEYATVLGYIFIGLGVLALGLWIYSTFIAKGEDDNEQGQNDAE